MVGTPSRETDDVYAICVKQLSVKALAATPEFLIDPLF